MIVAQKCLIFIEIAYLCGKLLKYGKDKGSKYRNNSPERE